MTSLVRHIIRSFSFTQRIIFFVALAMVIVSGGFLITHGIRAITILQPERGGSFTEGIVGQPSFINPVLAKNGTPDKDLTMLLFANIPTIAESIKHDNEYKTWNVRIKEGVLWHDNTPITSDDIIFTVQAIQNPDTLSPLFADWQNISVTRISEREVQFQLLNSYSLFEDLLKELRPIPKKLFADLSAANFRLSLYNLEPIGSGPYQYQQLEKRRDGFIEGYEFHTFQGYSRVGTSPYITTFRIQFYENEQKLLNAYNLGLIQGFHTALPSLYDEVAINSQRIDIPTTKYYAVFFNKNANSLLASQTIREALSLATDKERIIRDVFNQTALISNGPIPPTMKSYTKEVDALWEYNPTKAEELIKTQGWEKDEQTGIFFQPSGDQIVELSLTLSVPDIPQLDHIAQLIKQDWQRVGVAVDIRKVDPTILNEDVISTRNYEALLFGNILSLTPDLFSFWHSSERFYPGLNLSLYQNEDVDDIITSIRTLQPGSADRLAKLEELQLLIAQDAPAIFLASPRHFYIARYNIPGIIIDTIELPDDRFAHIEEWFVKTSRTFR